MEEELDWKDLGADCVVPDLQSNEKTGSIHELIHRSASFNDVDGKDEVERAVLAREETASTGFGRGVAIAHAESPEISSLKVAVGISAEGIEFDSYDKKPVHLLFIIVNPVGRHVEYLETLSMLTRMVREQPVRARLRCCTCGAEVRKTLRDAALRTERIA